MSELLREWVPTAEDRVEYWLGQLWGGEMPPSPFNATGDLTLPELISFQRELLETVLDPDGPKVTGVYGGIGCGKSVVLSILAKIVAMTRPGSVSLMSSDTYTNMHAITLDICRKVFAGAATWCGPPASEWRFPNGSIVMLRAYQLPGTQDESKNPWEGRTITGVLIVDEVQKLPEMCLTHALERARGVSRDLLGGEWAPKIVLNGRPGAIDWWAKQIESEGLGIVLRPWTEDNPHNGPDYMADLRKRLSKREFLCKTRGHPMPVKGAVYSVFEDALWPAGNLIEHEHDPSKHVTVSIDFGKRHPAVLFYQSIERVLNGEPITLDVIFDELQLDDVSEPELIRAIRDRGYRIASIAVDPAGTTKNSQSMQSVIDLFQRSPDYEGGDHLGGGLGCPIYYTRDPAKVYIDAGITRVEALMCDANGTRRLVVAQDVWDETASRAMADRLGQKSYRSLRKSLLRYSWEDVRAKRRGSLRDSQDHSHSADSLRYWAINFRWESIEKLPTPKQRTSVAHAEWRRWAGSER